MAQQDTDRSRGWTWVWVLVAVAAALSAFAYLHFRDTTVAIHAAKVERRDLAREVSANGKVDPVADFQAHSPIAGVVDKLFVKLGQHVQADQQLVRMDDSGARRDLAHAEADVAATTGSLTSMEQGGRQDADLKNMRVQVQLDTASLASLQKLQAQGAAAANEVAAAQQRLNASKARVAQIEARQTGRFAAYDLTAQRAQVAQARAALESARSAVAGVDIRAPFAGTVYALPVAQYQFVAFGETLLQVADLTKLQVKAYFDEPEIGLLKAGQPVTLVWEAKPGQVWHGHIVQAPTTIIAYGTRNVGECMISVDDAKGDLLPNTNVTARVTELKRENVLSLPREALHTDGPNDYVYKIVKDRLVRTPVIVGLQNTTSFEIVSGLNENDLVAVDAVAEADLTNGIRVTVQH